MSLFQWIGLPWNLLLSLATMVLACVLVIDADWMWKLVRGKDVWLINRLPYSAHAELMAKTGFLIVGEQLVRKASSVRRSQLASQFREIPDRDLTTTDAFVQAVKPS